MSKHLKLYVLNNLTNNFGQDSKERKMKIFKLNRLMLERKFQGIENLNKRDTIDLADSGFLTIDPDTFKGLSKVVLLYLNRNKITSLHPDTFKSAHFINMLHF